MKMDKFSPDILRMILRMTAGFVFITISSNTFAHYNGHNLTAQDVVKR